MITTLTDSHRLTHTHTLPNTHTHTHLGIINQHKLGSSVSAPSCIFLTAPLSTAPIAADPDPAVAEADDDEGTVHLLSRSLMEEFPSSL